MLKQRFSLSIMFKVLFSGLGFLSSWVVARFMGAEAMGAMSASFAFIAIFTIFGDFGFGMAHFKRVSEGVDLGKCIGIYSRIRIILGLAVTVIAFLGYHIVEHLSGKPPVDSKYYTFFLVILLATLLTNTTSFIDMTFNARMEVMKISIGILLNRVSNVVFKLFVAFTGIGIIYLAWSNVLSTIVGLMVSLYFFKDYPFGKFDKDVFRSYLKFAVPLTFLSLLETVSYNIDKVFISYFIDLKSVGYYAVAQSLALMVIFPADVINNLLVPTFTKIYTQGTNYELRVFALKIENYIALLVIPFISFLFFNSQSIFTVLYGVKYLRAADIFSVLILQAFFFIMLKPYTTQVTAMEKLKTITIIGGGTQILNILLNTVLVADQIGGVQLFGLGAMGSAISLLVCSIVSTIAYRGYLYHISKMGINLRLPIYLLVSIAVFYSSNLFFSTLIRGNIVLPLVLNLLIPTVVYFGILWSLKLLNKDDVDFFLGFFKIHDTFSYIRSELQKNKP